MTISPIMGTSYYNYNPIAAYAGSSTAAAPERGQTPDAEQTAAQAAPAPTEATGDTPAVIRNPGESTRRQVGKKSSPAECETCKNRKYQDGSDEGDVSFKAAAHIDPKASAARVMGHEREHVSNAYKKAAEHNGKVMSCNVTLKTAVCPECGRTYVAGGTTATQIKYFNEENPYQKEKKASDAANQYLGMNFDQAV